MHETRAHWNEVWEGRDPTDTSWFEADPATSHRLVSDVRPQHDAQIIDVGGGASRLVDRLLDDGWSSITVLDIAPASLAAARARLGDRAGDVRWETGDVLAYDHGGHVDVWHDRAVLHFLTDDDARSAYAKRCAATVRAAGHAVIATFAPDGPQQCSGLPVRRSAADDLAALFEPSFTLVHDQRVVHHTPWDTEQAFTFVTLRRRP